LLKQAQELTSIMDDFDVTGNEAATAAVPENGAKTRARRKKSTAAPEGDNGASQNK
jgi:hypothetical protein